MEEILKNLDELIKEGEGLEKTIYEYKKRVYTFYDSSEPDNYQNWISAVKRLIKISFPSELEEITRLTKEISRKFHSEILGLLRALKKLPNEPKLKPMNNNENKSIINVNNHQTQLNNQNIVSNIFIEAIKDEITGKDLKALKEIMKEYENEPEKTKETLLEKIKELGGDVLSNIVANILTNPAIYSSF